MTMAVSIQIPQFREKNKKYVSPKQRKKIIARAAGVPRPGIF
jgi:hypothetical protein